MPVVRRASRPRGAFAQRKSDVMSSHANPADEAPRTSTWSGVAATKFRAPRQRRDLVPRAALLQRACGFALDRRIALICAPAGFGKSTLLQQLAAGIAGRAECVWLSLDEDDNDINRLFVSLLGALRGVPLEWEVDPHILASQVQFAGPQSRAAIAAFVNALSSYQGERLLLICDDLHRVTDPDALQLLSDLIERLPPEVGMVLGSRTEPALSLARWRARGEIGELLIRDLQFNSDDAQELARLRQAAGLSPHVTPEYVEQALLRTQGWAAGLQLVLGAVDSHAVESMRPAVDRAAGRHLFDFFAQEVLAELPLDLREFVLQCSVLPELSPDLCNAVTARDDAHEVLETLYRRNLFLTALDESVPVLRFHDLFAEFLQTRLAQRHPGLAGSLHARAARADPVPLRAVTHWLKAGEWDEAIALMGRCVEPLLAEGGQATVARWIAQLPEAIVKADPDVAYLQALCAWGCWDFVHAIEHLEEAAAGFRAQDRQERYMDCIARLPRACNAVGRIPKATRTLAEADSLPLSPPQRMICEGARAWQAAALAPTACAPALQTIATQAEQHPELLLPAIDDMFNPFLFATPAALPSMLRIRALCRRLLREGVSHWQIEAMANAAWPELWRGERETAHEAIERQAQMTQRLSVVPMLALNNNTVRGIQAAMLGDFATGVALNTVNTEIFAGMAREGLRETWERSSRFCVSRILWMAGDREGMLAHWPVLSADRQEFEWPYVDTAREMLRGQLAIFDNRLDDAEIAFRDAVRMQTQWRVTNLVGDARPGLALTLLLQGHRDAAWQTFAPVLHEAIAEDCAGVLLMEPVPHLKRLLALMPQHEQAMPAVQAMLTRLAGWRPEEMPELAQTASKQIVSAMAVLSEREREVLARIAAGDSNKLIARVLDLSPHTVKRHVANILTKLDCTTRGQAAAVWRSAQ